MALPQSTIALMTRTLNGGVTTLRMHDGNPRDRAICIKTHKPTRADINFICTVAELLFSRIDQSMSFDDWRQIYPVCGADGRELPDDRADEDPIDSAIRGYLMSEITKLELIMQIYAYVTGADITELQEYLSSREEPVC